MKQAATGLVARLRSTSALAALLASDADGVRLTDGTDEQILGLTLSEDGKTVSPTATSDAFPAVSYEVPTIEPIADGVAVCHFVVKLWTWTAGATGGPATADALAAATLAALQNQHWLHDGARLHAAITADASDPSGSAAEPDCRIFYGNILVSAE